MSDYATLTDVELNRAIAERLGYRVEWRENTLHLRDAGLTKPGYVLVRPDTPNKGILEGHETEENAWLHVPFWTISIDPAMRLVAGIRFYMVHNGVDAAEGKRFRFKLMPEESLTSQPYFEGDNLMRIICEAWLAWKEATHA